MISKGGNAVVRCRYALDTSIRFPNDPTPQIEDEDFDFGLFICNVEGNGATNGSSWAFVTTGDIKLL